MCAGLPWLSLVLAQLIAARDWVRSNLLTLLHPINTLLSDLVLGIAPPKSLGRSPSLRFSSVFPLAPPPQQLTKLGLFQIIFYYYDSYSSILIIIIIILFPPRIIFLLSFIAFSSYLSLCSVSRSIHVTVGAQLHCLQQIPLSQPAPRSRSTVSKATHKRTFDSYRFPLTNGSICSITERNHLHRLLTKSAPRHRHFSDVCHLQSPIWSQHHACYLSYIQT